MHEYVMEQNAMDDKIIERCKTCKKQCMQEDLNKSRSCRAAIEQTSMDRTTIKLLSRRQKLSRWIKELSRNCRDCDKKKLKSSIDKPGIERCQGAVKIV